MRMKKIIMTRTITSMLFIRLNRMVFKRVA